MENLVEEAQAQVTELVSAVLVVTAGAAALLAATVVDNVVAKVEATVDLLVAGRLGSAEVASCSICKFCKNELPCRICPVGEALLSNLS
jgi:hypothetical protein